MSSDFLAKPRLPSKRLISNQPSRKRTWRSLVTAGVVTVALLGGTGAIAVGPASAAVTSASQSGPSHMTGMHGGWTLPLHGQFVVAKPGGGYQTLDFQRGSVTKISSDSITVKSTDGFTQSYAINGSTVVTAQRDGVSSVTTGDQAIVIATVSGGTATAVKIVDTTLLMHAHQQLGFGPGNQG